MKHSCGNDIPEDSAFCQHCGGKVLQGGGQGDLSDASSTNSPDFIFNLVYDLVTQSLHDLCVLPYQFSPSDS